MASIKAVSGAGKGKAIAYIQDWLLALVRGARASLLRRRSLGPPRTLIRLEGPVGILRREGAAE